MDAENPTPVNDSDTSALKPQYYAGNDPVKATKGYKYVAIFSILTIFTYLAGLGFAYYTVQASDDAPIVITSIGALIMIGLAVLLAFITLIMWAANMVDMIKNKVFTIYSTFYIILPVIVFFITTPILLN